MSTSSVETMQRDKVIVRTSIIGIAVNVLLAAFKALVGALTHSIAIVLDAVNNLSDAISSIITIVGTKLAGKPADKDHPYGHGRAEYLTAVVIAVIILYAGATSLIESIKKILHPETPDYTITSLVIVGVAVAVKIVLGRYVRSIGEKVKSDSLIASGTDAMMDSVISAATLLAALIFLFSGLSLEAWLGAVISVVILKSGYDLISGTISEILGERVDSTLSKELKATVCSFPDVRGAYDLVLHDYGPDRLQGSVHIEIPDYYNAAQIDDLVRRIQEKVYYEHHVILNAVSIYSYNTTDDEAARIREDIRSIVMSHDGILQIHGFFLSEDPKSIRFDMVVDFAVQDKKELYRDVYNEILAKYPAYQLNIAVDTDLSD